MKALDTNILVRFLVRDDESQADHVLSVLQAAERKKEVFFVPSLVLLKTLWVLESVYEIPRTRICEVFEELLLLPVLKFEDQSAVRKFVREAFKTEIELSDLLIATSAEFHSCDSVITFDKKACRYGLFELLD